MVYYGQAAPLHGPWRCTGVMEAGVRGGPYLVTAEFETMCKSGFLHEEIRVLDKVLSDFPLGGKREAFSNYRSRRQLT